MSWLLEPVNEKGQGMTVYHYIFQDLDTAITQLADECECQHSQMAEIHSLLAHLPNIMAQLHSMLATIGQSLLLLTQF